MKGVVVVGLFGRYVYYRVYRNERTSDVNQGELGYEYVLVIYTAYR